MATGVLLAGMAWDNLVAFPDNWFLNEEPPNRCVCKAPVHWDGCGGGWIVTSHAIWHFVALLSIVVTSVGTEYVVVVSDVLR